MSGPDTAGVFVLVTIDVGPGVTDPMRPGGNGSRWGSEPRLRVRRTQEPNTGDRREVEERGPPSTLTPNLHPSTPTATRSQGRLPSLRDLDQTGTRDRGLQRHETTAASPRAPARPLPSLVRPGRRPLPAPRSRDGSRRRDSPINIGAQRNGGLEFDPAR